jgi:hypothetical protein
MSSRMCRLIGVVAMTAALLLCPSGPRARTSGVAPPGDNRRAENEPDETKSLTEVNTELSSPISSIWSLTLQQNTYWLTMPGRVSNRNQVNLQFQPVLPVALTGNWNLISRPVFQALNSTSYINRSGHLHRVTGFGDTIFVTMLSPSEKLVGKLAVGSQADVYLPNRKQFAIRAEQVAIGPAGVVGYLGEKFLVGLFPQQRWSVGGPGKNTTSQLNLQYFASYFFRQGLQHRIFAQHARQLVRQ